LSNSQRKQKQERKTYTDTIERMSNRLKNIIKGKEKTNDRVFKKPGRHGDIAGTNEA
jgi:hypothetical protein